jgi:hypothetical protein
VGLRMRSGSHARGPMSHFLMISAGGDRGTHAEDAGAVVGTGAQGGLLFGDDRPDSSNRDARSTAAHLPLLPVQLLRIPLQERAV